MSNYLVLEQLEENSVIPLYVQLSERIRRQIQSGRLTPGDQLPSEREFCEVYGVSTITVKQAMRKLADEGLLYRKRGKGTFIAEPKLSRDLSRIYSFTEDMKRMGLEPSSQVLGLTLVAAQDLAEDLRQPSPEDKVVRITRLRLADGVPLLLETTHIPRHLAPGLENEDLATQSLYAILKEHYQVEIASAVETFESIILSKEEAGLLECQANTPGFHIERLACDASGTPVELTSAITRADRCKFSVTWGTESSNVQRELTVS